MYKLKKKLKDWGGNPHIECFTNLLDHSYKKKKTQIFQQFVNKLFETINKLNSGFIPKFEPAHCSITQA